MGRNRSSVNAGVAHVLNVDKSVDILSAWWLARIG
jgi:hypothetical protein